MHLQKPLDEHVKALSRDEVADEQHPEGPVRDGPLGDAVGRDRRAEAAPARRGHDVGARPCKGLHGALRESAVVDASIRGPQVEPFQHAGGRRRKGRPPLVRAQVVDDRDDGDVEVPPQPVVAQGEGRVVELVLEEDVEIGRAQPAQNERSALSTTRNG